MTKFIFLIFLTFIFGCKDNRNNSSTGQERDLIMKNYFQTLDSLPFVDSLDTKLKLIKAYYHNDTNFLNKAYNEIDELFKNRKQSLRQSACEQPNPIDKQNFDEAYRFNYGAAFCDKAVTLTIGKNKEAITLDLFLFQVNNGQTECKTLSHTTKLIDTKIWDELKLGINFSDFWGLKEDNGNYGSDGSSLRVTGFEKPINAFQGRYKTIYRWAAEDMAIGQLFKKLLDESNTKVECFHYK